MWENGHDEPLLLFFARIRKKLLQSRVWIHSIDQLNPFTLYLFHTIQFDKVIQTSLSCEKTGTNLLCWKHDIQSYLSEQAKLGLDNTWSRDVSKS